MYVLQQTFQLLRITLRGSSFIFQLLLKSWGTIDWLYLTANGGHKQDSATLAMHRTCDFFRGVSSVSALNADICSWSYNVVVTSALSEQMCNVRTVCDFSFQIAQL